MPGRIVTYAHRPKRPPRKQPAAPLPGPAVVTRRASIPSGGKAKATPAAVTAPPPANDDRKPADGQKPAIVTAASRKQPQQRGALPPEKP
jgi:hypothetical protein